MRKFWSEEEKKAFWAAFVAHRDEGCRIREAYSLAAAEFQKKCRPAPGWGTFAKWYQKAMQRPEETAPAASDRSDRSDPPSPRLRRASSSDYTDRLEAMVKPYRFRRESDVDEICDRLLPELN